MITTEQLQRRIKAAEDLQSIVRTMKALAAANINQYERAVEALAGYGRTLEMAFQVVIQHRPEDVLLERPRPGGRLGALVFGSDQGLVGQFNERVASYALETMQQLQPQTELRSVLAVGLRAAGSLELAKQPVDDVLPAPGSASAITPAVQRILLHIERWRSELAVQQVIICYNKAVSNVAYASHHVTLLPIDLDLLQALSSRPWPNHVLPTFSMDWDQLFSGLTWQQLFVGLYRALAESMASENASRLASMQAAERNIGERLEELSAEYHQLRQTAITAELLDIVSGFEALAGSY
jgi:F-type H+-transporting ATPase subunit gamma